jgi:hypothetical protein
MVVRYVSASRCRAGNRHSPIAVWRARIDVCRRASDQERLVYRAAILILDRDFLAHLKKREENINIYQVIRQVADVDLRRSVLRCLVPQQLLVARIARR